MPRYWLFITSPENFEICVRLGLWGVDYTKRMIKEVSIGDHAFFYIRGRQVLIGLFIVTSNMFEEYRQIWPNKLYPFRVKIQQLKNIREINI
ncbi:MAG: EVE domain-containing protein [Candidatus Korarchaeota archaeon]|nr:EVE domain-containing protein [Candidatus Korarchaeota archaeon]